MKPTMASAAATPSETPTPMPILAPWERPDEPIDVEDAEEVDEGEDDAAAFEAGVADGPVLDALVELDMAAAAFCDSSAIMSWSLSCHWT